MEKVLRIPFFLAAILYGLYLGYEWYEFNFDDSGEVASHKKSIAEKQTSYDEAKKKLEAGLKFKAQKEAKLRDLQERVKKLAKYKGALAENLDYSTLLKLINVEARVVGLKLDKIEPGKDSTKPFYVEHEYKISMRGTYTKFLGFFQRLSQLDKILRVEAFRIKPLSTSLSRSQNLDAELSIHTYQYKISSEDSIGVTASK